MRLLRFVGTAVLTAGAAVGVVCALVWGATAAGWVQPLVVISGSMEPGIRTGDLIIATRAPVADLEVGEVATLRSAVTGRLVTHRVTDVTPTGPHSAEVRMRGDANDSEDGEVYRVEGSVWQPAVVVGGGGTAAATLSRPTVAVPLLAALAALLAMTFVPRGATTEKDAETRLEEGRRR